MGSKVMEGEFLLGKIQNGYGILVDNESGIKYKGGFKNGLKHGKAIDFGHKGSIIYEGKYKKGERWSGFHY